MNGVMNFFDVMNHGICIPKIQREYAQGRLDAKSFSVRKHFVTALFDAILKVDKNMTLDFIYGIKNEDNQLMPLDGQQRLTTLFLFAWICGVPKLEDWKFNYESRRATEFFLCWLSYNRIDDLNRQAPCNWIRNQNGFYPSWEQDPSVAGMLTMLDAMGNEMKKNKINAINDVSVKLKKITFLVKSLEDGFSSGTRRIEYEKIFLKMNDRGIHLTDWENIKAVLDKYLELCNLEDAIKKEIKELSTHELPNVLWRYTQYLIKDGDRVERSFSERIALINSVLEKIARLSYVISLDSENIEYHNEFDIDFFDLENTSENILKSFFNNYYIYLKILKQDILQISKAWTLKRNENYLWNSDNVSSSNSNEENLYVDFEEFLFRSKPSMENQLRFSFLITAFNKDNKADSDRLKLCVLLNLLDNTDVDQKKFYKLLKQGSDYLSGLIELDGCDSFNENQLKDEKMKAKHPWDRVSVLERNDFVWRGSLRFLYDADNVTIDELESRLNNISEATRDKTFFHTILGYMVYDSPDKRKIPSTVIIPRSVCEEEWAENIFSCSKVRLHPGIHEYLIRNTRYNTVDEQRFPAWLKHYVNLDRMDPSPLKDMRSIRYNDVAGGGWNYCYGDTKLSASAIRLARDEVELQHIYKYLELPYVRYGRWEVNSNGTRYVRGRNELWYEVFSDTWYANEPPLAYQKNELQEFSIIDNASYNPS